LGERRDLVAEGSLPNEQLRNREPARELFLIYAADLGEKGKQPDREKRSFLLGREGSASNVKIRTK